MPRLSSLRFHDRLVQALTGRAGGEVGLLQLEAQDGPEPSAQLDWTGDKPQFWLLLQGADVAGQARDLALGASGGAAGLALLTDGMGEPEALFQASRSAFAQSRADSGDLAIAMPREAPDDPFTELDLTHFELHLQPQASVADGRMMGVEALVRVRDRNGELSTPDAAIAAAEARGDLWNLTEWSLMQAGAVRAGWQAQGLPLLPLSINLSLGQFAEPDVVARLEGLVTAAGLAPPEIEFELTERAPPGPLAAMAGRLAALREHGFGLALDDLGTGFASLSLLAALPLDKVKLDRRYVRASNESPARTGSLREVVDLGRRHGVTVLAEGVERDEELATVKEVGCALYQGYHFSPPLPVSAFSLLLAGQRVIEGSGKKPK